MMKSHPVSCLAPWGMLVSRPALFFIFQTLLAGVLALKGSSNVWSESARWWLIVVILTNLVSVFLLVRLFQSEGKRYLDILKFRRNTFKTDILWLLGSSVIGLPVAAAPMNTLAVIIYGDAMTPINKMFQELPAWALALGLLFPLTIAFAELTTYFGYVMPRLADKLKSGWAAWLLASLFLAVQHAFLPFLPEARFFLWRAGMYLPFALFAGLLLKLRPSLLPYMVIIHALVDISAWSVYFMI